jgi:hypothetical protein
MDQFKLSLTGEARDWIANKQFQNADELKGAFTLYFSGLLSREASMEAFRALKWSPSESIEKYMKKLCRLAGTLNLGQEILKEQFLNGLPFNMKMFIIMSGAGNLQDLTAKAQRYADLMKEKQQSSVSLGEAFAVQREREDIEQLSVCIKDLALNQDRIMTMMAKSMERREDRFRHRSQSRDRRNYSRGSRDTSRGRQEYSRDSSRGRREQRHMSQERFRNSSRSSDRSRIRDQTPHRQRDNSQIVCNFCEKKGHTWRQCHMLANKLDNLHKDEKKDF